MRSFGSQKNRLVASIDRLANSSATRSTAARDLAPPQASGEPGVATSPKGKSLEKALHAKAETLPITYNFNKVKVGESELTPQVQSILNRFQINANATKYDTAVMSDDGNTLVIANRGEVALKQLFGGANWFNRTVYRIFGWLPRIFGASNKVVAADRYKELFNGADIEEQGEPLKHVLSALKSGEYHTVTVFHKDEKTGEFAKEPVAVVIVDAFDNLIETHSRREMQEKKLSEADMANEIKEKREKYGKYYSADKVIPLSTSANDFKDLLHQVVEGLYAAQGFDAFVIPSQVHAQANMNSNDLNYAELDWHYIKQKPDGKWSIVGDPKLLDTIELSDPEQKDTYLNGMTKTEYSPKLTVVRPIANAEEPISPFLANLQQWSTMSQGSELRTSIEDDLKLIKMTEPVNAAVIEKYNNSIA